MNVFFRMVIVLFALFAFLPGYVLAGDKTLKIDPRHVEGFQDMRSEITSMLEILGYEQLPLRDPSTGQPVNVAEEHGHYRMLFRAADNGAVQVEVHIRINDNMTGLHFSEVGADQPSDTALEYFRKLEDRVVLEFGGDNVSDKHSFTTP